jgi:UDP-3-O-[3-hydroxymyristoyl] glucosamine N-acyltransferase
MMVEKFSFNIKELKTHFDYNFRGFSPFNVYSVSNIQQAKDNTLLYSTTFNDQVADLCKNIENAVIILPRESKDKANSLQKNNFVIFAPNPKIEYGRILDQILLKMPVVPYRKTHLDSFVSSGASIGKNVIIEPFVHIDEQVVIEDECTIKSGARINKFTRIGRASLIGNNAVIGSPGFDIETDSDDKTYQIPHIGGVSIKNNVSIGSYSVIAQGRIYPTMIHEFVRLDSSVIVASDVEIKNSTVIAAHSVISTSTTIGRKTWIGPGSVISNNLCIGDNVRISLGSIVVEDVNDNESVSSNFAIKHEKNLEKYLLER